MEIVDALYIGFFPATLILALAGFFAYRSPNSTARKTLLLVGCLVWAALLFVIVWRVALLFMIDCSRFAEGTQVDCGDLYRSTVVVPIIFAIPLVPLAVVLVAPWLLANRKDRRRSSVISASTSSNV